MTYYVYRIECPTSMQCYIGVTGDIEARRKTHLKAKCGSSVQTKPGYAMVEQQFRVLFEIEDKHKAWQVEGSLIAKALADESEWQCLNSTNVGRKHTTEARAKMSRSQRERAERPEVRARMSESQRGLKHTIETRAKMSKSHTGRKHSLETKAKMSKSHTGRKHTAESRAKMSKAKRGKKLKPVTAEARANMSKAAAGRKKHLYRCNCCSKVGHSSGAMSRWHGSNCTKGVGPKTLTRLD